jgi:hypothetical protein
MDVVDSSLVAELDKSGFIDSVYKVSGKIKILGDSASGSITKF